jgi:hypothetical protein
MRWLPALPSRAQPRGAHCHLRGNRLVLVLLGVPLTSAWLTVLLDALTTQEFRTRLLARLR